mmetsp:Transcript_110447/g.165283  ORF Transcript_110447/g.165283 Transcript_110447/m.165283 type:complete len:155 (+) Transcript_110447:292-756(+)
MLQAAVLEHHEPTLRLILQKSKFLTKAVKSFSEPGPLRGTLLNCLNLLRIRSVALPPSAFLHQYLGSHDGWKENCDRLIELTIHQQTPIKNGETTVGIDIGSPYAARLGLGGISQWDATAEPAKVMKQQDNGPAGGEASTTGGNKKKKKKKKKK